MSATRLAALALLAGGVLIASCREPAKSDAGPMITLRVNVATPNGSAGSTFCADGLGLLLSIEEEDGQTSTFLYDQQGTTLFGCADEAETVCADQTIQTPLARPVKVTLEYIDVTPATYLLMGTFGVLCRGVADGRVGTDLSTDGNAVTATVRLLRVGAVNRLFPSGSTHPKDFFLAGSSTAPVPSSGEVARTGTGGGIVFAGGFSLTGVGSRSIHRFDPGTVSLATAGSLVAARGGLTATAIAEQDGSNPRVLFAGGAATTSTASLASAELYDPATGTVEPIAMHHSRSGHSAVYLEDYETVDFTARPAVVLMAGCNIGVCAAAPGAAGSKSSMEAFFLDRPEAIAGGICLGAPAGEGVCTYTTAPTTCGSVCTDPPRSLAVAGPMKVGPQRAYVGHGYDRVTGMTFGDGFRLEGKSFMSGTFAGGGLQIFGGSIAILGTAELGIFGGYLNSLDATDQFMIVKAGVGMTGAVTSTKMLVTRGSPTATALFDRRVLITGGNVGQYVGGTASPSIEIHDPLPGFVGSFHFVARDLASCVVATDPGCEKMLEPRNGHAAVRIDGSLSWLNGAVVIAGGQARAVDQVAPEIFVPDYRCDALDGQVPATLRGRIDYCDRGRQATAPTDPSAPSATPD